MKKILLTLFILISAIVFSQNPLLLNKTWHLYSLDIKTEQAYYKNPFPEIGSISFTKNIFDDKTYRWDNSYYLLEADANIEFGADNKFRTPDQESKWLFFTNIAGENQEMNYYANLYHNEFLTSDLLCMSCGTLFFYEISSNGKKLTITNDRGNTATYYDSILAVSETEKPQYKIYPNPTSDLITIENLTPNTVIELVDNSGKMVKKAVSGNFTKTDINIKNIAAGVYYLKINNQSVQKVIKK